MSKPHPWIDWWFRDRTTGKIVVGQFPNATLGVWIAASAVHAIFSQLTRIEVLRWVGAGALLCTFTYYRSERPGEHARL